MDAEVLAASAMVNRAVLVIVELAEAWSRYSLLRDYERFRPLIPAGDSEAIERFVLLVTGGDLDRQRAQVNGVIDRVVATLRTLADAP